MREGENGADIVLIETMATPTAQAAVVAAKRNTPAVYATVTFDESGRLLTGADVDGSNAARGQG